MHVLPKALQDLIDAFGVLPGVGPRSAERYALFTLKGSRDQAARLSRALEKVHGGVKRCPVTNALISADEDISPLYSDPARDKTTVAVVADPFDIVAIEKTGQFSGTYHVLGGLISPIDGVHPEDLHVDGLLKRITDDAVAEVILATNASVEGETTAMYIQKQLDGADVKVSRLARGLPIGVDIEYADQITLGRALEGRTAL